MKRQQIFAAMLLIAGLTIAPLATAQSAQTPAEICSAAVPAADPETREFTEPEQVLEPGVDYRAVLCTSAGAIYVDLFENFTPVTVNNFVFLVNKGYFNNTTFHRVIREFMAQGGDPTGTGMGGPGYRFKDEFVGFLFFDVPGWLAMANAGPGTNGSQFFITTVPTPHLDYRHTIFGEVLEGQENVASIELRDPETAAAPGTTLQTVVIITDPTSVATTYRQPEPPTKADIEAEMRVFNTDLPELLTLNTGLSGSFTTEQVVASAPEAIRADYADYLSQHHHQFRVASVIDNTSCDLANLPFISLGYALDAFATREDAAAALADEFLTSLPTALGFTETLISEELNGAPVYTQTINGCEVDATRVLTYWQRGHYLVTVEVTVPADTPVPLDIWLSQFVGITLERGLAQTLRAELR